ncbi:MAG: ATP-grasp domain-containing protein [Woeseiaceae bacterium]|jgi:hypothetical protein|nr:ATP-grasp domain-containing protein [Woeseiaceae bacterium]
MPRTALLTLGRLPVGLDIARSFSAAGWRVIVAEPYAMHLCRMSRSVDRSVRVTSPAADPEGYLRDLARIVAAEQVDLVIPVSEETLRIPALRDTMPPGTCVFAAEAALLHELHDKYRFTERARAIGLAAARSWLPGSVDTAASSGYVIKPRRSCSGRGVRFAASDADVRAETGDVVQERLVGDEVSGFGVARSGELLAPVVYRSRVSSGSVAVCFERVVDDGAVVDWMRRFVSATGYSGFIAFDFIVVAGQPVAIECNPRATSGIHFLAGDAIEPLVSGNTPPQRLYRDDTLLAEKWSCYTATLGRLRSPGEFAHALGLLFRSKDVSWRRADPWPFLLMPVSTFRIIADAIRTRSTFAEVAVADVAWRDAPDPTPIP